MIEQNFPGFFSHLAICFIVGVVIGLIAMIAMPRGCKSIKKFFLSKKWYIYLLGAVFCSAMATISYVRQRPFSFWFFVVYAILATILLFRYGFKRLTHEQEAEIDASQPERVWPFYLWTQQSRQQMDDKNMTNEDESLEDE